MVEYRKYTTIVVIVSFLLGGTLPFYAQDLSEEVKIPWKLFSSRGDEKKNSDDSVVSIIPEYFLLGTLRFIDTQEENQVDCYSVDEEPLLDFLKDYIKEQLKIDISIEKGKGTIRLFSVELTTVMSKFFDKNGLLDISSFDSKEKINSYLSGYYLRSGSKLGEDYYSFDRHNTISPYFLLEKAGCQKIVLLRTKYHIPGGSVYYFEPSVLLEKYFEIVEKEMIDIQSTQKTTIGIPDVKKERRKDEMEEMIEQIFDNFER
ncbi:hypothetical protein LJC52_04630 [Bacteroidales bacterium OttesenSCG-928-A17]|nr:hypothetical protein [Bacteroidales bacterium OttesenSCG-928-A17]